MMLPLSLLEWFAAKGIWRRPDYLLQDAMEAPSEHELIPGIVHREVRGGHPKWAHFLCPRCREHISIPIVGRNSWRLTKDLLRRPTLHPSVWQTGSCGAHFFIRHGKVLWCAERYRI